MTNSRLETIESKLAFQELTTLQLSDTLHQQQKQIDHLELLCQQLIGRVQEMVDTLNTDSIIDEKPPHY